ncbi:hypothetical protein ACFQ1L_10335 [Phytohabitans flavus]|uniref:hypothetical protein n=1 Tax=Phytohabitans flavus TaxID=1076124 RepID=UPI00362A28A1
MPGLRREDLPVLDRLLCMAWEWVAPVVTGTAGVVGVVFTWFAGAQGRKHTERMIEQTRLADDRTRLLNERKDAYLTALRTIELRKRRERYRERGKLERIQQLDERWPKAERVHMEMEALIGIRPSAASGYSISQTGGTTPTRPATRKPVQNSPNSSNRPSARNCTVGHKQTDRRRTGWN